jgi:hypothetical protein
MLLPSSPMMIIRLFELPGWALLERCVCHGGIKWHKRRAWNIPSACLGGGAP